MDNNKLEDLLRKTLTNLCDAMENIYAFGDACPEGLKRRAGELSEALEDCKCRAWGLLCSASGAAEQAPQADNIKDAIALLEANGFIVGTKT